MVSNAGTQAQDLLITSQTLSIWAHCREAEHKLHIAASLCPRPPTPLSPKKNREKGKGSFEWRGEGGGGEDGRRTAMDVCTCNLNASWIFLWSLDLK